MSDPKPASVDDLNDVRSQVAEHDELLNGVPRARGEALTAVVAKMQDEISDADLKTMRDDVLLMKNNAIPDGATKFATLDNDVRQIKGRINQVTGLVVSAIVAGLLSMLFKA
ncbi:MAG: hypothetical protein AAF539_14885 [Planctomycetota bacterium]